VTEIENFQKLTHLNQFSCQKHTHARVWVILQQLPAATIENAPTQPVATATSCETKAMTMQEQRIWIRFLLYGLQVIGHRATMVIPPTIQAASPNETPVVMVSQSK